MCDHQILVNHTGVANDPSFVLGRTDVRSKASRRGARASTTYMQSDAAAYASAALSYQVKGSTDKPTLAKLDERMLQIPWVSANLGQTTKFTMLQNRIASRVDVLYNDLDGALSAYDPLMDSYSQLVMWHADVNSEKSSFSLLRRAFKWAAAAGSAASASESAKRMEAAAAAAVAAAAAADGENGEHGAAQSQGQGGADAKGANAQGQQEQQSKRLSTFQPDQNSEAHLVSRTVSEINSILAIVLDQDEDLMVGPFVVDSAMLRAHLERGPRMCMDKLSSMLPELYIERADALLKLLYDTITSLTGTIGNLHEYFAQMQLCLNTTANLDKIDTDIGNLRELFAVMKVHSFWGEHDANRDYGGRPAAVMVPDGDKSAGNADKQAAAGSGEANDGAVQPVGGGAVVETKRNGAVETELSEALEAYFDQVSVSLSSVRSTVESNLQGRRTELRSAMSLIHSDLMDISHSVNSPSLLSKMTPPATAVKYVEKLTPSVEQISSAAKNLKLYQHLLNRFVRGDTEKQVPRM